MSTIDEMSAQLALGAEGLLGDFNTAEIITAADVHVAQRMGAVIGEVSEPVQLALALTVRASRRGSICVDLAQVQQNVSGETLSDEKVQLGWPEPQSWLAEVAESQLVAQRMLRLEGSRLYLDRYWREECQVRDDVLARLDQPPPEIDEALIGPGLDRVFGEPGYDEQRAAVNQSLRQWTTILTGGPGTGKTTTVAGLLALVCEQYESAGLRPPRIALCAPTGKAAARLQESIDEAKLRFDPADQSRVSDLHATTMHSLLGPRGRSDRFRHNRANPLPYDLVVVDETSMVALTMMARLCEALRPQTRLVLVGDADQLSSVDAGAVLSDLVVGLDDHPAKPTYRLVKTHRYGEEIGALAQALRDADADAVMSILRAGQSAGPHSEVQWIRPEDETAVEKLKTSVASVATRLRDEAERGNIDEVLSIAAEHRLLCAHREGAHGVGGWNRLIERLAGEQAGVMTYAEWYPGRPVLVTANDPVQKLRNGDTGVVIRDEHHRLRVVMDEAGRRLLAPTRLPEVATMHAMTVHKAQGSQAKVVTVVMPPEQSRLLSRELFYTAVTRASEQVRIFGSESAIRAAVSREVQRATGLAERLSGGAPSDSS